MLNPFYILHTCMYCCNNEPVGSQVVGMLCCGGWTWFWQLSALVMSGSHGAPSSFKLHNTEIYIYIICYDKDLKWTFLKISWEINLNDRTMLAIYIQLYLVCFRALLRILTICFNWNDLLQITIPSTNCIT